MIDPGLAGRTALVTGGASGIGAAIVAALEAEGVRVAIVDPQTPAGGCLHLEYTLGSPETSDRVVAEATAALGRIDLLVNCAAVARHEPVTEISPAAWDATIGSNFAACVWTCRSAARGMIDAGGGSILVVGSTSVYTPATTESLYRSSKAALRAFTEVLALELAPHGIRVNMLTPGAIRTPLTAGMGPEQRRQLTAEIPLHREALPAELAPTALLLLSDELSPYTTGAEFVVDGGIRLRPLR